MKEKLVNELIETFMKFKKLQMHNIFCNEDLSYNESYILHKLNKESSNVHLSIIRDKLKLAPSSITNLITSLEEKKYITRVIDKKDRRNIYIKITDEG
ncbi:MAG: winged helix DNA-binding protein, partial [Clostridia bacterium]